MNFKPGALVSYGLIALGVWLGWEIVKAPIIDRTPPSIALRLAPRSAETLRRAGEHELSQGRADNAAVLAAESLSIAPFNARSMRVLGLSVAKTGNSVQADTLLTLAGNWSLRDDPAHAWLVEYRLRQGSYASAFAHADTLVRRRSEFNASVFSLFTIAVLNDPRALAPLAQTVGAAPPWRSAYLAYLLEGAERAPVAYSLAIALRSTPTPFSDLELRHIYQRWFSDGRLPAIQSLRARMGRPENPGDLQNGDFSVPEDAQILPFGWHLFTGPGVNSGILEDDLRTQDDALRVEYDGNRTGALVEQILMLPTGPHRLQGEQRLEVNPEQARLRWVVTCLETGSSIVAVEVASRADANRWVPFEIAFEVPPANCSAQRLQLEAVPRDRRELTIAWFDKFRITQTLEALVTGRQ